MADEITLYDNLTSSNALKVRFLANELGIELHRVEVPLTDVRPDWYRTIHPFGTVPCLVDGDLVLVESNTMLRYLADRTDGHGLYPREPADRARVDQLLDALSLAMRPLLWDLELVTVKTNYLPAGDVPTREQIDGAAVALADGLAAWEQLVSGGGYLTGAFSIADVAATARMWDLPRMPIDLRAFPRTREMLDVVGARPAFQQALVAPADAV